MDDFIGAFLGSIFGVGLLLLFGGLIFCGWLLYKLVKHALLPLGEELAAEAARGVVRLVRWYRAATWRQRVMRIQNEAILAIDAVRHDQVAQLSAELEALERQREALTTVETAAVRDAVRVR